MNVLPSVELYLWESSTKITYFSRGAEVGRRIRPAFHYRPAAAGPEGDPAEERQRVEHQHEELPSGAAGSVDTARRLFRRQAARRGGHHRRRSAVHRAAFPSADEAVAGRQHVGIHRDTYAAAC